MNWLILALTAAIGYLIVMLKLQGSKLQKAQLSLLSNVMQSEQNADNKRVQLAKDAFAKALREYHDAINKERLNGKK